MEDGDLSSADDGGCAAVWTRVVEVELHGNVRWVCLHLDPTVPKDEPGMPDEVHRASQALTEVRGLIAPCLAEPRYQRSLSPAQLPASASFPAHLLVPVGGMNSPPGARGPIAGDLARAARLDDGLAPLTLPRPAPTSSSHKHLYPVAPFVIVTGFWLRRFKQPTVGRLTMDIAAVDYGTG